MEDFKRMANYLLEKGIPLSFQWDREMRGTGYFLVVAGSSIFFAHSLDEIVNQMKEVFVDYEVPDFFNNRLTFHTDDELLDEGKEVLEKFFFTLDRILKGNYERGEYQFFIQFIPNFGVFSILLDEGQTVMNMKAFPYKVKVPDSMKFLFVSEKTYYYAAISLPTKRKDSKLIVIPDLNIPAVLDKGFMYLSYPYPLAKLEIIGEDTVICDIADNPGFYKTEYMLDNPALISVRDLVNPDTGKEKRVATVAPLFHSRYGTELFDMFQSASLVLEKETKK